MTDEQRYTFTMRHYDGTVLTLSGNKEGIHEVLEDFKTFLVGATFHPNNIDCIQYIDEETFEDKLNRIQGE